MQEFDFQSVEEEARKKWNELHVYKVDIDTSKPKYYVLDMFPYPSGAGLHVGHPLGYIASDIFSRYKRLKGYNVLHPMGFDAFGLPAEQYALQTGQHPAKTTKDNIETYKRQLGKIGFSYDWSREVVTAEPNYYRWTQWIFSQLFKSWYNNTAEKAQAITELVKIFEQSGNLEVNAACDEHTPQFTAEEWKAFSEKEQQDILMHYRLAYQSYSLVNWCPGLGTVLANDEIVNGVSERGGFPVERKKMSQWFLRITAYAERLLTGLDTLDWSVSMKDMQRNWIGKSIGAKVSFPVKNQDEEIEVFTTRVDTIYGVSFMTLAPEHELVEKITTAEYKDVVQQYQKACAAKSDIERQQEKKVSGQFTGAYAIHPLSKVEIPIYISDYVLLGYGTGAVMAVPSGDERDYRFAKHFDLPIIQILDIQDNLENEANPAKEGKYVNSDIINGMSYSEAVPTVIAALEKMSKGTGTINYRLRDAGFSRQRYWGEPFPVYYDKDGIIRLLDDEQLPLTLPEVEKYQPTADGHSPLAHATDWVNELGDGKTRETDTMPAFAGSSWYFLRYMDPHNEQAFVGQDAQAYWQNVDLYIGGTEHAVGHLLYSRFWHKFFKDNAWVSTEEPFKKLVNQGMIQGVSKKIYRYASDNNQDYINSFIKKYCKKGYEILPTVRFIYISKKLYEIIDETDKEKFSLVYISIKKKYFDNIDLDMVNLTALTKLSDDFTLNNAVYMTDGLIEYRIKNKQIKGLAIPQEEYSDKAEIFGMNNNVTFYSVSEVEKMSKSKLNVVNPDDMIEEYGADTFRMFEMFLGPIEAHKPWDINGIEGVSKFVRKVWRLYNIDENGQANFNEEASKEELKVLHKAIKKAEEDIERFSFNTVVSGLMIAVNEWTKMKKLGRATLETLPILMSPFAPFVSEVLWSKMGKEGSVINAAFPSYDEQYLKEDTVNYPVSFNGKVRFQLEVDASFDKKQVEEFVLAQERTQHYIQNQNPKKIIVVLGKIVNIVM